jgi:hypothetical protein
MPFTNPVSSHHLDIKVGALFNALRFDQLALGFEKFNLVGKFGADVTDCGELVFSRGVTKCFAGKIVSSLRSPKSWPVSGSCSEIFSISSP